MTGLTFGMLSMLVAGPLMAATLSAECEATNRGALDLEAEQRLAEAEGQLSRLASAVDGSNENLLCLGVTLANLGSMRERLGKLDLAEGDARRSMAALEATLGPGSSALRDPLVVLSLVATDKGRFSEALRLLERAEDLPPLTPLNSAICGSLKAVLLVESGEIPQAERAFHDSIAELESAGAGATPTTAPLLCDLAIVYLSQARIEEALPLLERALKIAAVCPLDQDTRIKILLAAAIVYAKKKDRKQAEVYFLEAIHLADGLPKDLRPEIGRSVYREYISFLRKTKRKREASALQRQADARFAGHPDSTVDVLSLLERPSLK